MRSGKLSGLASITAAAFLSKNLPRGTTTAQTWQFLNTAITTYCPDQMPVLTSAAGPRQ
jgi:hypothetical protein